MNKIKAIFANRKFSLDGLIEVICALVGFIGLVVVICTFYWLFSNYPAETGASLMCVVLLVLVGCVLTGIIDTIFPKRDDPEIGKWIEAAEKELNKQKEEKDESN